MTDLPLADTAAPPLEPSLASADFLACIARDFAREHLVLSQGRDGDGRECLAVASSTDACVPGNIGTRLGRAVRVQMVAEAQLVAAIDRAYERVRDDQGADTARAVLTVAAPDGDAAADLEQLAAATDADLLATTGKAPLVRLVDRLLFDAITRGASDVHLQPGPDQVLVRQRIDGVLDAGRPLPASLYKALVSRLKVMGQMDVADRLVPQDGRCTVRLGEHTIDVRLSTLPSAYGERVVMRLLDSGRQLADLAGLGMSEAMTATLLAAANRSSGIILVTGPTGSGKTTTLYATLRRLPAQERNLMTIEDPIEYDLGALGIPINQSQVNLRKGVNFANGLRHVLRQDPDVIMVGEIRDAETARIAIQASLTGHLVLTTLHTNDAVSAVTRLIDLGVEPYLVGASLSVVLAQRLVRSCCTACGGPERAAGCTACQGSGYRGRLGLFELLSIDDPMRRLIAAGADVDALRDQARSGGLVPLAHTGAALVAAGRTTAEEIERVVHHG